MKNSITNNKLQVLRFAGVRININFKILDYSNTVLMMGSRVLNLVFWPLEFI